MQALWLEHQNLRLRQDIPVPQPAPGSALVKVHLAGICATDLEMVHGYYPFSGVLGHEFVGSVAAAPEAPEWLGQRVVGEINLACSDCPSCRRGHPSHCENREVLGMRNHHGAIAEYLCLPIQNLQRVPQEVPDELAVFCEPLAAALEINQQVHIHPEDRVLLVGAGRLGQLISLTLSLTGCDLSVVVRHPYQRKLLEARHIAIISETQIKERAWDVVVDATGSAAGFELARKAVRPRGTLILKSTYKGNVEVNLSALVVDEISLIGSRCGPFSAALRALNYGWVDPSPLITARYPLSQAIQALEHAAQSGVLKILIDPHETSISA